MYGEVSSWSSSFWPWSSSWRDASSSFPWNADARYPGWFQNVMCRKPFRQGVAEYGCGQCLPCRINRRRIWTLRLMLEATQHEFSQFVTLSYRDEYLPLDGGLDPRDLTLYLKRLRQGIAPRKLRYYAVGEYGDRSFRPHYHLFLFGSVSVAEIADAWGGIRYHEGDNGVDRKCVDGAAMWSEFGRVHVGTVTLESAGYLCSYALKRMTHKDDQRLGGRYPEFARMSLKPGIGFGAVDEIAKALLTKGGSTYVAREHTVPNQLRYGGQCMPMGRYLTNKVREAVGMVKSKYYRGEAPIELYLLQRQWELYDCKARELRENKRYVSGLKADRMARNALLRKGMGL